MVNHKITQCKVDELYTSSIVKRKLSQNVIKTICVIKQFAFALKQYRKHKHTIIGKPALEWQAGLNFSSGLQKHRTKVGVEPRPLESVPSPRYRH